MCLPGYAAPGAVATRASAPTGNRFNGRCRGDPCDRPGYTADNAGRIQDSSLRDLAVSSRLGQFLFRDFGEFMTCYFSVVHLRIDSLVKSQNLRFWQ
jgi:hypothetical protein